MSNDHRTGVDDVRALRQAEAAAPAALRLVAPIADAKPTDHGASLWRREAYAALDVALALQAIADTLPDDSKIAESIGDIASNYRLLAGIRGETSETRRRRRRDRRHRRGQRLVEAARPKKETT